MPATSLAVTCEAGRCMTYSSLCGHPCASGTSCLRCIPSGNAPEHMCAAQCP